MFDKAVKWSATPQVAVQATTATPSHPDMTSQLIDLVVLINVSHRIADGCPRLINKATVNVSVSERASLSDVERILQSKNHVRDEPIEFGISRDDSIFVLDKTKTLREHGIGTGAVVTVLPKRISISIVALNDETSKKLNLVKPIGLIVRSDYRFVDIERPVCSHLKVPLNSLIFQHNDNVVNENAKTMRDLNISDGSVVKVSLR